MPVLPPFGLAYKEALTATGYKNYGDGDYPEPSLYVQPGYQWVGYSLFDAGNNFQRNASDALLERLPNLVVKTRHTARSITFIDTDHGKTANCVVYRPTKYQDIRPIGDLWSLFPSSAADWAPWIGTFLEPTSVLVNAGVSDPTKKLRRVCLSNPGSGRIVVSGGAVNTPLLLYRSGIGPAMQLKLLKVPQVLDSPAVGSAFSDRVFLSIPGFLKHYSDSIPLINPSKSLRRLQANEDTGSKKVNRLQLLSRPAFEPILTQEELEKAITPEVREAINRLMNQEVPDEIITVDEDDSAVSNRFEPPVLLPDFLLFPGVLQYLSPALQPRVCQFMGLKYTGPRCKSNGINERNLGCSLVTMEELSGDRLAEGFIYASRYMFPTAFRKDPILDAVTEIIQSCSNYRSPFGIILLKPLCVLAQPIIKCLRKAVAPFYFTSEPKSRGSIRLKPTGEVVVDPQYLVDEQDLFDAIRGTATLVEQLNGDSYRGIIQEKGPQSCPLAILNGLLDILLTLASTTSPFLTHSSNFAEIQRYLQDLIPPESRRLRRLMVVNEGYRMKPAVYEDEEGNEYEDYSAFIEKDVDEAKIERLGIKRRLEAVGFDFDSYRAHVERTDESAKDPSLHLGTLGRRLDAEVEKILGPEKMDQLKKLADSIKSEHALRASKEDPALKEAIEDCRKPCTKEAIQNHTCAKSDVCCTAYGNSKCMRLPGQPAFAEQQNKEPYTSADAADSGGAVKKEEFLAPFFGLNTVSVAHADDEQWAATYPPRLPSVQNPKALAKFALTYMTSIGHTYGSAPMGRVVDDKFQVKGVNGLSIVDASVLPQLTRMNPVFTIMALGRYAGEMMLGEQ
ncbi:oxidoreductase, putative [Eimeria necatrix]|uniref:Oxidoreductase, putative n=1 Tax=Eimeria necatrix TaxID=51315 RepID=U6MM79_9EIME|nr:oxidoreductase, putative [Eimeria necatrix]CDJ65357.1 oxidoreductase, putative [Eimeria necatrix]